MRRLGCCYIIPCQISPLYSCALPKITPKKFQVNGFLNFQLKSFEMIKIDQTRKNTVRQKNIRTVAVFRCKMAFLKSKFKDDPVRVQRHTVSHFKGLD